MAHSLCPFFFSLHSTHSTWCRPTEKRCRILLHSSKHYSFACAHALYVLCGLSKIPSIPSSSLLYQAFQAQRNEVKPTGVVSQLARIANLIYAENQQQVLLQLEHISNNKKALSESLHTHRMSSHKNNGMAKGKKTRPARSALEKIKTMLNCQ